MASVFVLSGEADHRHIIALRCKVLSLCSLCIEKRKKQVFHAVKSSASCQQNSAFHGQINNKDHHIKTTFSRSWLDYLPHLGHDLGSAHERNDVSQKINVWAPKQVNGFGEWIEFTKENFCKVGEDSYVLLLTGWERNEKYRFRSEPIKKSEIAIFTDVVAFCVENDYEN